MSAVVLGLVLASAVLGGAAIWRVTRIEGRETCLDCAFVRDVNRRGPFWSYSPPRAAFPGAPPTSPCAQHDWVRSGCWQESDSYVMYAPAPLR